MRTGRCFVILAALLLLCPYAWSQERSPVRFGITQQGADSAELLQIAKKIAGLPRDFAADSAALREAVRALRMSGMFGQVSVENDSAGDIVRLVPARYVRDVRIRREYPLFEDEVERSLSTYPGEVFRENVPASQDSLVTALYRREGFIDPQIDVVSRQYRFGDDRELVVQIRPGEYYRLSSLEIRGNNALSTLGIKRRMKTWRTKFFPGSAGRFVESALREDIRTLIETYRSKRFVDVSIADSVTMDPASRIVGVVLSIGEGERYSVKFSRRSERGYGKRALRKKVTIFKSGNRNNAGIRKSVRAITKMAHDDGFLDARITALDTTVEKRGYMERTVRFDIDRKDRAVVSSIDVRGCRKMDEETIRARMLHSDRGSASRRAYNPERLEEDMFAIRSLYRSRGFHGAVVSSSVKRSGNRVAITVQIDEGTGTRIRHVAFDSSRFEGPDFAAAIVSHEGGPWRSDQLRQDALAIQSMIAGLGYPHAIVTPLTKMSPDSALADVEFRVEAGPYVTMGDIRYVGAFRTREKVLNREFRSLPGNPFSLRDIVDAQKGVRDLGLFSSVRFRTFGLAEKRDTVHVFVEVAEKRPFYGAMSGGYQSDKGPFASAQIGDRNLGGLNKEGWIGGEVSATGYRGETGLEDSRFLGTRLRSMVELAAEKEAELNQKWHIVKYSISSGITATPPGSHITVGLGGGYERRRLYYDDGFADRMIDDPTGDLRPRNIIEATPTFSLDLRDSFTRPRKGSFLGSTVKFSHSIGSSLDDFVKLQVELKRFFTPVSRLTLAGVVRGGYILPYGDATDVATDQRFFLGGTGDVRGFDENLLHPADSGGANVSFCASVEARFMAGSNIELTLFADVGRLENDIESLKLSQFRSSAGGGVRYITPIGPVGLLYGRKLDPEPGESKGRFHFSLGYTF